MLANIERINSEVRFIEIVFENCESIEVPADRVSDLYFEGMTTRMLYQSHLDFSIGGLLTYRCEAIRLSIDYSNDSELSYDGYSEEYPLGMYEGIPVSNSVVNRPHVLGRITENYDITHVNFVDENKESILYLAVPFKGDCTNELMSVEKDNGLFGKKLVITIKAESE
ncbi:hypothetical protein AB1K91_17625 [Terribacillus sp. 179-K 1B1 HS]|uniref:hypothetical protein n=1 Tax=Terribacillus sp. 179-K 1B1 HS TaxID=3142388 RepID=UPI0039A1D80C